MIQVNFHRYLSAVLLALGAAVSVSAHPTFIVDARASLSIDDDSRLSAIHIVWVFDDVYSQTLLMPYNRTPEGQTILSAEERAELVSMHTTALQDFGWFVKLVANDQEVRFLPPDDFDATLEGTRFALDFTLRPDPSLVVDTDAIVLKIFDPSFVVAFLVKSNDIEFIAPENCSLETDAGTGSFKADVLSSMNVSPQEGASIAESMAPPIRVRCT